MFDPFFLIDLYLLRKNHQFGSIVKQVVCENCSLTYVYEMERTAGVMGFPSEKKAKRIVEQKLRKKLELDCDLVPCPHCGWYQKDMIKRGRKKAGNQVPITSLVLLTISGILAFIVVITVSGDKKDNADAQLALYAAILTAVFFCMGMGLAIAKYVQGVYWNPNKGDASERIRLGKERAVIIVSSTSSNTYVFSNPSNI